MDEQENMMVDEEMTDGIEETNQDEQETTEVGEKETENAEPLDAERETAETEEESESGQSDSIQRDFEKDAAQAAKRRERERKEEAIRKRIEQEAYTKGLVDAVGGENPYTHEPIKDAFDVEEYLVMREIEKNGGDPVADYAKTTKEKQREKVAATEVQRTAAADLKDFRQTHPDVDVSRLLNDARFARFAGKRIDGGERLSDVYADYIAFTGEVAATAEKKAEIKAKNAVAKKKASPGSLTGGGGEATKATYDNMTDEAFEREIAKAKAGALKKS